MNERRKEVNKKHVVRSIRRNKRIVVFLSFFRSLDEGEEDRIHRVQSEDAGSIKRVRRRSR